MIALKTSLVLFPRYSVILFYFPQQTGSQYRQESPDGFTSESKILDIQRAERAALIEHAERLCAAGKARNDALLERLGLSTEDATLPSPQPPAFPRSSTKSSVQGRRIRPLLDEPCVNMEDIIRNWRTLESLDEEDDISFWDKVFHGSQMAARACEKAQTADRSKSPTASNSLRSVDTHTPSELRTISLIESHAAPFKPTPPPPRAVPLPKRRVSRLPVLSAKFSGAGQFL